MILKEKLAIVVIMHTWWSLWCSKIDEPCPISIIFSRDLPEHHFKNIEGEKLLSVWITLLISNLCWT